MTAPELIGSLPKLLGARLESQGGFRGAPARRAPRACPGAGGGTGVPVRLGIAGDGPLGAGGTALVRALGEALINAVRHGSVPVSAYVEVGPALVEAFVRDHGPGFDLDAIPGDRLGVRESILGRMSRHGGSASVRRLEDGTEVALSLPVALAGSPAVAQPDAEGTPR